MSVLVYVEQFNGKAAPVSWEVLGKARQLADQLGGPLAAVVMGDGVEGLAQEAIAFGADIVHLVEDPSLASFRIDPYAAVVEDLVVTDEMPPGIAAYAVEVSAGGEFDGETNTVTWEIPSLGPGHSLELWIKARTNSTVIGMWLTNMACVDAARMAEPACAVDVSRVYAPPQPPPPPPPTPTPTPTATPAATLAVAKLVDLDEASAGDELHYTAIGDPPGPPGPDGTFAFSGNFEVTGGTGRFTNATGSATFRGTANLGTMTGQVTYIGHITF